jgi:hypothetical protein
MAFSGGSVQQGPGALATGLESVPPNLATNFD